MNRLITGLLLGLTLATAAVPVVAQVAAVPNIMNFQGRLAKPDGTPVADSTYAVRFSLHDAATGGTEKWNQTLSAVAVRNGTFAVLLSNFPAGTFSGNLWLEIQVGNDAPLSPRQPLASVAYAMKAGSVQDGAISNASLANGTITAEKFAPNAFNPLAWLLGGNSGVTNGFLGTTDSNPLELRVNNRRVMRYSTATNSVFQYRSVNVLGGIEYNSIVPGVTGATIAGGGMVDERFGGFTINQVMADFGTVGGGNRNIAAGYGATVAGGDANNASGPYAAVAGGFNNSATKPSSFVGGGYFNFASNDNAVVGGGSGNRAGGSGASIGGGINNNASGDVACVPGGQNNVASGLVSFAAGYNARAVHDGSFVWGDNTSGPFFASTAPNQFLIRAAGGVGINTNDPAGFALNVVGSQKINGTLVVNGGLNVINNLNVSGGLNAGGALVAPFSEIRWPGSTPYIDFSNDNAIDYDMRLILNGNDALEVQGGTLYAFTLVPSDARYKENIATLPDALDTILHLRGVSYDWNRMAREKKRFVGGRQLGFIAQEVEKVLPELVNTNDDGYRAVNYVGVVPVLVEAVKTLKKENDTMKKDNATLKAENAALQAKNVEVEARLAAIEQALAELKGGRK